MLSRLVQRSFRGFVAIGAAGCLLSGLSACTAQTQQRPSTVSAAQYARSAQELFDTAQEAFEKGRWTEANTVFGEVRSKFPFSRLAALALLRQADCSFKLASYAEAAVTYSHFLKTYPTHEEAHYASFMTAESYYEQIPGSFFLMPPPYERDLTAARNARGAYARFLQTYPNSAHVPKAREHYREAEAVLVRHEMYVANFYLKRDKRKAATVRLEHVIAQFPDSPLVPEAMLLQAETFLKIGEPRQARQVLRALIERFPQHPQAARAKEYLRAMPPHESSDG